MSSHLHVYVGWFFLVPKVPTEKIERKTACVSASCKAHGEERRAKFCQDCGQPLGTLESRSTVDEQISMYDLDDFVDGDWVDEMCQVSPRESGEHFWIPNHSGYGVTMSEYEENEPVIIGAGAEAELARLRFNGRYAAFQKAVEDAYGITLQATYGVVPYYM